MDAVLPKQAWPTREKSAHLRLGEHQEIKEETNPNEKVSHHLEGQRGMHLGGERNQSNFMLEMQLVADIFNLPAPCREHRG